MNDAAACYAHSLDGRPPEQWQPLEEHLRNVASLACSFAEPFGAGEWAWLAGLWHDLGKYQQEFQNKLLRENGYAVPDGAACGAVNHSSAGALLAAQKLDAGRARILAYLIMGHHAGLTDFYSEHVGQAALEYRMRNSLSSHFDERISQKVVEYAPPAQKIAGNGALWIRMLFSCLVDADFLDTERFMDSARHKLRSEKYPEMSSLCASFDTHMERLSRDAGGSEVNRVRQQVFRQCIRRADEEQQVYSLTVPTGGGKTLSSLGFALHHARRHDLRRIIYVVPFTSIIEQTADVFRGIPGFAEAVVEHHSNIAEDQDSPRSRLAAENWDAPVIVTTAVQFFESLYAARPGRCRKLHNITHSVVIFDEAQCLPPKFLRPCVQVIKTLTEHYGVTPVLCTATQPVLNARVDSDFDFREGFETVREIVDDTQSLFGQLKRVDVHLHSRWPESLAWDELASELSDCESVLCIVNRRDDCRELHRLMPTGTIHLSALMCGEHRSRVIVEIKRRLREGIPTRVISTQLVEAGVDIDFPVVYRAMAGIDSIAQAAGRCNREGRLDAMGRTVVFVPSSKMPQTLKLTAQIGREVLEAYQDDPLSPEPVKKYFRELFRAKGTEQLDQNGILDLLPDNNSLSYAFRTAAERFRLIDENSRPVVVQYGDARDLIERLEKSPWEGRILLRRLQRYTVNLPSYLHGKLGDAGCIRELKDFPGVYVQDIPGMYREDTGLCPEEARWAPDDLII